MVDQMNDDFDLDDLIEPEPEGEKVCNICLITKKTGQFNRNISSPDGFYSCCKECVKIRRRARYEEDKDSILEKNRVYYKTNKDFINSQRLENSVHIKKQRKEWREQNKDYTKAYNKEWYDKNLREHAPKRKEKHLKHYFGLTLEQFNEKVKAQDGKCEICKCDLDMGKATHVDHDHYTDTVRDILCHNCNTKYGWYETNYANVIKYTEKHRPKYKVIKYIPT